MKKLTILLLCGLFWLTASAVTLAASVSETLKSGGDLRNYWLVRPEGIEKTNHEKIYVGHPLEATAKLKELMEENRLEEAIRELCRKEEDDEIRNWIREMVPGYQAR